MRHAEVGNARRSEQALFGLTLVARLGPWLLAFVLLLPAYLQGEDNRAAERVGFITVVLAVGLFAWWAFSILRVAKAIFWMHRCCRLCPEVSRGPEELPLLLYPGRNGVMAVAGIFSARILVSQRLLEESRFSAAALDVAFAHERAHARHRDNLKALLLALLPKVPLSTTHQVSLAQQWRLAAEMAADEEGTQGMPERSLLLAEMLVTFAQEGKRRIPEGLMALCSGSEHLRLRVERLLQRAMVSAPLEGVEALQGCRLRLMVAMAVSGSILAALCYGCNVFGHRAAELLFRVG